jgi:hypothetical protein
MEVPEYQNEISPLRRARPFDDRMRILHTSRKTGLTGRSSRLEALMEPMGRQARRLAAEAIVEADR